MSEIIMKPIHVLNQQNRTGTTAVGLDISRVSVCQWIVQLSIARTE